MDSFDVIHTRGLRKRRQVSNRNWTSRAHESVQQQQPPMVSDPPMINVDTVEDDDDDVVESTADAFYQAKRNKTRVVVNADSGENRTRSCCDSRKSKSMAHVEELKFNCPICMCTITEETTTKCGHIFCNSCIKKAISNQAKCPSCRKKVTVKDLIRIFLPTTTSNHC